MEIIYLLIGLSTGAMIGYLASRLIRQKGESNGDTTHFLIEKSVLEERISTLNSEHHRRENAWELEKKKLNDELSNEKELMLQVRTKLAQQEESMRNMERKMAEEKETIEKIQQRFVHEFDALSQKILDEKSKKFTEQNKEQIEHVLNPLKEKISVFEKQVKDAYEHEVRDKISLREEVKKLIELNKKVSEEANNLAHALKGDSKTQGNWGELVLEKVLERSGLKKDIEYKTQVSGTDDELKRVQPDVVVFLPDEKHIIIDSKVSMVAYERMVNATEEQERKLSAKAHVESVRNHIKQLGEKDYTRITSLHTPDFVLLFMPIEAAFSAAIQEDAELFNLAWDKKIVIVSPTTLLATLKTISSMWKQERQVQNALEIAKAAGDMYDKFVGFTEDLKHIGKTIDDSKKSYDNALNKLTTGKGNLISRAEKLKALGAKADKQINQTLIDKSNFTEDNHDE